MNINELDNYNLADAVKFHDRLNPRLWDNREHLRPEVHATLMAIAREFQEFLGVPDLDVVDITISGSNAAYNYTRNSDIDLHLVVKIPDVKHSEVYRELFNAKKYEFNDAHNITIGGADVELYVQDSEQAHHSQGIYSLLNNDWVSVPKRHRAQIDDACVRDKVSDLDARIHAAIQTNDPKTIDSLCKKIKIFRQAGLEQQGEFGCDNLAFKILRNSGCIKALWTARDAARDAELSLPEQTAPRQRVRYGFSESPDGVNPTTKMFLEEPIDESPDGVNPTTKMFLENDNESVVHEFISYVCDRLGIVQQPKIILHTDPGWSEQTQSFGRYTPNSHTLEVNLANRHIMDILRTVAHEMVHCRQNQQHELPINAGDTGSEWENQANALAGVIMRDYADAHAEQFADNSLSEATGYIPKNKKEARDPRFSMAISPDVHPGQVGTEANKMALHTGRNGEPGLLMKTVNLRESIEEASYEGNIGAMETFKFYQQATPEQKIELKRLLADGDYTQAWQLIQQVTDTQLVGREFAESMEHANKLDSVLARCIQMIAHGQKTDPERYGRVAACLIDSQGRHTYAINLPGPDGTRRHAERVAINKHLKRYKEIGPGAVMVTTLSPCVNHMSERYGEDCADLLADAGIERCYAGYQDPTQQPDVDYPFELEVTNNTDIFNTCKQIAQSFLPRTIAEGSEQEGLVSQFLKSITPKELRYYSIRDNCGPAALHMMDWAKEKGIELNRVHGYFVADNVVYDKADFTKEMKHEFLQQGLDFNDPKSRREFIASNPKYSKEWKKVPHYWLQDDQGTVYDPTGYTQFIKTGVAKDLDKSRYETVQGMAEDVENFNGIDVAMEIEGDEIMVRATAGGRELGHVLFVEEGEYLMPQDLEVDERFQGQGIAAAMYDYVKSKGYRIRRSGQQTDAGAGFWGKHRPEQNVWENFIDGKHPEDKGDSKRYGVPTKASVSTLRKVAKQGGRKGQLSHWMANMKAGRAKAKKE